MTTPKEAAVVTRLKIKASGPTPNRNTVPGAEAGPPGPQPGSPTLPLTARKPSRTTEGARRPLDPLRAPGVAPSRPGPRGRSSARAPDSPPPPRPAHLPGRVPREPEEGQVGLRALPCAIRGGAEVRHGRPATGRSSPPLPASSGQQHGRPAGPGRGAGPAGRPAPPGRALGGGAGRRSREGQEGRAGRGRAGAAAPQCCERPGGFTAAAAAAAPPARPGRCRLLPTMHPGARGCPLSSQSSSSLSSPATFTAGEHAHTSRATPTGRGLEAAEPGASASVRTRTAQHARGRLAHAA